MAQERSKNDMDFSAALVESLFPACKIVQNMKGYLELQRENLEKVVTECVRDYSLPNDIPVAILSIIGPPSSGKSFLTNLLIQYYKAGGEGDWLEKLTKKSKDGRQPGMTGFQWDSVDASLPWIYKPNDTDLATSGVYLWPQPFIINSSAGTKLLVWILHLCKGVDAKDDDLQMLERFLMLACSRVTEIKVGDDDFRSLREVQALKSFKENPLLALSNQEEACDSIVYLFRSENVTFKTMTSIKDEKAKEELASLLKNTELDPSVLNAFKHINIAKIKDVHGNLHDIKGCLDLKVETDLPESLKYIVELITEESKVTTKKTNGTELQVKDFIQFLQNCVNAVNDLHGKSTDAFSDTSTRQVQPSKKSRITPPSQSREQIAITIEKEDHNQDESHIASTVDTNLNEGTTDESCPNAPRSLESKVENASGKDFVFVEKEDCGEQQNPKPLQAVTRKANQEEQLQQQRQQKHDAMRNMASNAVSQLKGMMSVTLEKWLTEHLSPRNVTEIKSVYGHLLKGVAAEGHKYIEAALWKDFESLIDAECQNVCIAYLDSIQQRIEKFLTTIKKKFDYFGCLRNNELEKLGSDQLAKVSQDLLPDNLEVRKLVEIGCLKLMDCFRADNMKIIDNEVYLAERLIPDVLNFYDEEMTQFLRGNIYDPKILQDIHKTLAGRLVEVFKISFKFTSRDNICENFERKLDALKNSLGEKFAHHLQKNNENLKRREAEITKLLKTHKEVYIEKIEDVLRKNSDGLETLELTKKQDEIVDETKKLLEMEIKQKIREDEPVDVHLRTLQTQIDDFWKCALETNNNNVRMRKEREEQERKRAAEERRLEKEREERRSARLAEEAAATLKKSEVRGISDSTSADVKGKQLLPLVFQLQHTRITMGMLINDKPQILKNSSGQDSIPFVVGLSNEGDLQYGSEVLANINQKQDRNTLSNLKQHWWVAEYFIGSGAEPCTDFMQLNDGDGTVHEVSVEFLLAFFLKKLKEQVEADEKGSCSIAVITVPFWFCSTQRIQVKDGAKLAGFSEVYLINEAAAAAYACVSSETRSSSDNNIFVISENSERIDVSIYEYFTWTKTVRLVGHSGSYCIDESRKGDTEGVTGLVSQLLSGANVEENNKDKKLETVKKLCTEVIKKMHDPRYNSANEISLSTEVFVTYESEEWKSLLEQIGGEFGSIISDINGKDGVVFGAALLSRNLKDIGQKVKDRLAFDVLGKCEMDSSARVIPKNDMLLNQSMQFTITFPLNKKEGQVFQKNHDCNVRVGSLRVNKDLSANQSIEVCLTISNEAIVKLADVLIASTCPLSFKKTTDYDWKTPNLTQEDMSRLQSLLESLTSPPPTNAKIILLKQCQEIKNQLKADTSLESLGATEQETSAFLNAKQILLNKCQEMDEQLKRFAKRIEDAVQIAHHANSTRAQIEDEMESLMTWSSKYLH